MGSRANRVGERWNQMGFEEKSSVIQEEINRGFLSNILSAAKPSSGRGETSDGFTEMMLVSVFYPGALFAGLDCLMVGFVLFWFRSVSS